MNTFSNILVYCDRADAEHRLMEQVMALALANRAVVTLVDVVGSEPGESVVAFDGMPERPPDEAVKTSLQAAHLARLWNAGEPLRARGITTYQHVLHGGAFVELDRKVRNDGHDLLIKVAAHQSHTGARSELDLHLLRKCQCPVWLMAPDAPIQPTNIAAAVATESENVTYAALNRLIVNRAASLRASSDEGIHLLNAWSFSGEEVFSRPTLAKLSQIEIRHLVEMRRQRAERALEKVMAGCPSLIGSLEAHLVKGDAPDVVSHFVQTWEIDLLVMGTVEKTWVRELFVGSTAESIVNRVDCSILAIRPPSTEPVPYVNSGFAALAEREQRPKISIST